MQFFQGVPLWHVSVSVAMKPIPLWTPRERQAARQIAFGALAGIGDETRQHTEEGNVCIHYRRAMNAEEIALLPYLGACKKR